jgi:hypothetical protein
MLLSPGARRSCALARAPSAPNCAKAMPCCQTLGPRMGTLCSQTLEGRRSAARSLERARPAPRDAGTSSRAMDTSARPGSCSTSPSPAGAAPPRCSAAAPPGARTQPGAHRRYSPYTWHSRMTQGIEMKVMTVSRQLASNMNTSTMAACVSERSAICAAAARTSARAAPARAAPPAPPRARQPRERPAAGGRRAYYRRHEPASSTCHPWRRDRSRQAHQARLLGDGVCV